MIQRRDQRGTSPITPDQFNNILANLNNGQYAVIHQMPPVNNQPPPPPSHLMRNLGIIGGLGAGIGALYRYRQPLMKLGQKAINYVSDKFHNLC